MTCDICGRSQIVTYERGDGIRVGTCCIVVGIRVAERHELARQIHRTIHGTDDPRCPKCALDDAERMLWGR